LGSGRSDRKTENEIRRTETGKQGIPGGIFQKGWHPFSFKSFNKRIFLIAQINQIVDQRRDAIPFTVSDQIKKEIYIR